MCLRQAGHYEQQSTFVWGELSSTCVSAKWCADPKSLTIDIYILHGLQNRNDTRVEDRRKGCLLSAYTDGFNCRMCTEWHPSMTPVTRTDAASSTCCQAQRAPKLSSRNKLNFPSLTKPADHPKHPRQPQSTCPLPGIPSSQEAGPTLSKQGMERQC